MLKSLSFLRKENNNRKNLMKGFGKNKRYNLLLKTTKIGNLH
jgi:hypothetical protein